MSLQSQAEPRAALSLAARGESPLLKLSPSDLVLYSAKARSRGAASLCLSLAEVGRRGRSPLVHYLVLGACEQCPDLANFDIQGASTIHCLLTAVTAG